MATGSTELFRDRFVRALMARRWLALFAGLLVLAVAVAGTSRLTYSNDYRLFFDNDNPDLAALRDLENTYAKTDAVMLVLHRAEGDLFTPEYLGLIRDITDRLWQMPHASRVDSITNYQHSWAEDDDLYVADLVPPDMTITPADAAWARDVASHDPLVLGRLISGDGRTTGLVATLHMPDGDDQAMHDVADFARDLAEDIQGQAPGITVAVTGSVMLNAALFETASADTRDLFPLMVGVLFLCLLLFFRSPRYALAVFAVVVASVATAMGGMGWFGIPIMSATAVVPVMVLTVAVADAVHLLVGYRFARGKGLDALDAGQETLTHNLMPVIITSITTGFGFLALNFSDAPPYRYVGNMAALGTVAALFFTFTLLPALMAWLPAPRHDKGFAGGGMAAAVAGFSARKPVVILAVFVVLAGVAAYAAGQLKVNDKFVEYFDRDVTFRKDAAFISDHLPGLYFLEFSVPAGGSGAINEPDYLLRLDRFAAWLEAQPEVTHVSSMAGVMKRLNRNMHGDDPDWYRLPESRQLAAQYLLLYEMSLPFGRDLNDRIDVAKSATRVTAVMDEISTGEMQALKQRAEGWLDANMPTASGAEGTGVAIIFAYLTERTMKSMAKGAALAILAIAASLMISLGSVRLGALSLLVNLVPILLGFGAWALIKGEIGLYAAAVGTTALGLIVDFAVHMIAKYKRLTSPADPVHMRLEAVARTVGPALTVSAVVLIAGFLTLDLSNFLINAYLGLMTAIVIAIALVTDLTLLPALLGVTEKRTENHGPKTS